MGDLLGVAPKDANAQVEPSNIQNMQILQASVAPTALSSDIEKKIASTDMIIEKPLFRQRQGRSVQFLMLELIVLLKQIP